MSEGTERMQGRGGRQRARAAAASRWLLAAGIAGSALAVGTVHTITLCIVTAVLAVAAALGWWGAEPMRARSSATLLLMTGIGLTAYTALQCVPMPIGWLAVIAPHNADVWSRALSPLHEPGPSWAPISLDPIATRVEVLKGVAYLLAFVTALRVARRKEGVGFLSAVIVATGIVLALAAVLHPAFGSRRLFGVFDPGPGIADRHIAPLMNANNLAGYLTVALCLSLAILLAPEPRLPRPIAGVFVLLLAAAQVWVASRGGVIAMLLGGLLVAAITQVSRKGQRPGRTSAAFAVKSGLGLLAGAVLVVMGGSDDASKELFVAETSKLKMVAATLRALPSMPLFGCGRGAFESAFPAFRVEPGYITWAYPENVVVQWLVEWGLPAGLAGLVAVAFAMRPNMVLARSSTAGGAWAAVVALTVQNFGDLGSEVPGLVLAGVVCAAVVTAGAPGSAQIWRVERWALAPRAVAALAGTVGILAILLTVRIVGEELHADQLALYDAAIGRHKLSSDLHGLARAAMLRHPAEPYLPFVVSVRCAQDALPETIGWVGAALERAKVYGPAHLVLARVIRSRSPAQSRLEYRMAMEQAPELLPLVLSEAPALVATYWDATELVPASDLGSLVLDGLALSVANRLPATRVRLDRDLEARLPGALGPAERLAQDAVEDLESQDLAPWCSGDSRVICARNALDLASRLQAVTPTACAGHALHARALAANGEVRAAFAELDRASDLVADRVPCFRQLLAIAKEAKNGVMVEFALDRIVRAGCTEPAQCAQNLLFVALEEEERGERRRALALCRRAYDQSPDDDGILAQIARLASVAGLHAESHEAYERLARKHPEVGEWAAAAARERESAMKELL